jgi:hypothetical protein
LMRNAIRKFMDELQINKADLSATTTESISEALDRAKAYEAAGKCRGNQQHDSERCISLDVIRPSCLRPIKPLKKAAGIFALRLPGSMIDC